MRILLTGTRSFVGHHIATHLLSTGHSLTATYRTSDARIELLRALATPRDLVLAELNIAERRGFSTLPPEMDVIVHVAGATTATGISIDEMLACNVAGTSNVLAYALASHVKQLIYVSTLSIHGKIRGSIVDENTPVIDPDPYGASKYLAERLLAASADKLACTAIRVPGVLGRGAQRAWLPTVLERALSGQDIAILNPGAAFNNAIHVDDLAHFIESLARQNLNGFSAFPIAARGYITIRQAVERVLAATGARGLITAQMERSHSFTISSDYAIHSFGYNPMEIGAMIDRYVAESL